MLGLVLLAAAAALPRTPKKPVAHVYQGVKVVDEYEWLEDENDPKVSKWSDAENAAGNGFLFATLGIDCCVEVTAAH